MKIGELFVQLGVKADTFTVRDFSRAIGDIPFALAGAIASLAGASFGFLTLTRNTLDLTNTLGLFRSQTGLSIDELQKWQAVARQVGISGDAVQQSILGISQAIAAMRTGHADPGFLLAMGQMGVDIRGKNPFQILQEVMQRTRGRDPAVMSDLLSRARISPEMMRIFSLGPDAFNRMAKQGPVLPSADLQAMQDFQEALARFGITLEREFVPVLREVQPYLKDLADALGWLIVNVGGFFAKGIGEDARLFNHIREVGASQFLRNLFDSGLTPDETRAGTYTQPVTVNQNIHSTADATEVARIAKENFDREKMRATKQFNNGGY